jgi:ABC-2 type transport system permease protein
VIRTIRAVPTLLRIGFAETVAYRAELLVWVLTMTMPLVMLALWKSAADEAPFAHYQAKDFIAYYLANMIVRNLTNSWVAFQVGEDIRLGTMSMRLLRPIHPFVTYGCSHLAAVPFRSMVAVPIALALLVSSGADAMTTDVMQLLLFVPSIALAWLITFSLQFAIGCLAFYLTQMRAAMTLYYGAFAILSGYFVPLDLMPAGLVDAARVTPFPSMLATPVALVTRDLSGSELVVALGTQLAWATACVALALGIWRSGLRRFEAVGA